MSVEVRPVGVTCNLRCDYCYESELRSTQAVHRYDRDKVLHAIEQLAPDQYFSLFGGEPMLLADPHLEELLSIAHRKFGRSGMQTNGSLIQEHHLQWFQRYNTHIGISLDGPDELNDSRWAGTLVATREQTRRTHRAIEWLVQLAKANPQQPSLAPSLIVTLHAGNCSAATFPKLVEWFKYIDSLGCIRSINLHVMELDDKADKWYLDPDELGDRLLDLWNLEVNELKHVQFAKFHEILELLKGNDQVMCVWHTCDPWNTGAVQGIENDGAPSHCSRTNKDGINWLPAEGTGDRAKHATVTFYQSNRFHERQLALAVTPQEVGGCKDCPYWVMCFGQCPGTGENNDWRKRTTYCSTFKKLFAEGERRLRAALITPLTDWHIRKDIERRFYESWVQEKSPSLGFVIKEVRHAK